MNVFCSFVFCLMVTVTKVIDGDTIRISTGETIRLIGIDAPESRNAFKKVKEPFGKKSKQYLTDLLLNKQIRLDYDVARRDRYGRTLAYVYLMDSTFVNEKLVREGYATVMTVPPNVKFAERFVKAQREARSSNRGLWGQIILRGDSSLKQ